MKIQIILSRNKEAEEGRLAEETFALLEQELGKQPEVELTQEHPDVLHIIGGWTESTRKKVRWAYSHFLPVIHTPLASLSPWMKPSASDIKLSEKANRLVASGNMEYGLLEGKSHHHTLLILNPLVTSSISTEEAVSLYMSYYLEVIKEMDLNLRQKANDKVNLLKEDNEYIKEICRQLFYIHDLNIRGFVPETTLKKFAVTLRESDYDEDHMEQLLKLIHMDKIMAEIERRLFDTSLLTEGFMPIPMKG